MAGSGDPGVGELSAHAKSGRAVVGGGGEDVGGSGSAGTACTPITRRTAR